jgi:hypothetical protein
VNVAFWTDQPQSVLLHRPQVRAAGDEMNVGTGCR